MEKIKLNDGTVFDIVSGSYEYVNIIAPSVDEVVSHFTDSNLAYCEILSIESIETINAETNEVEVVETSAVRAMFTNKHMKNFRAEAVESGYDIVIPLEDVDKVAERLNALEETVDTLVLESLEL